MVNRQIFEPILSQINCCMDRQTPAYSRILNFQAKILYPQTPIVRDYHVLQV